MFEAIPADLQDLESLSTIFPRSFHPVNAFQKRSIPDTSLVRQWWIETYTRVFSSSSREEVLVVRDSAMQEVDHTRPREEGKGHNVIGVIRLRRFEPGEKGAGFWTEMMPLTRDHDGPSCMGFIVPMAEQRFKLLGDTPHLRECFTFLASRQFGLTQFGFLLKDFVLHCTRSGLITSLVIALLGTDSSNAGRGVGSTLLRAACELADSASLAMYVEAGIDGKGFYEKFGFETMDKIEMKGSIKYVEYFLVRPAKRQ